MTKLEVWYDEQHPARALEQAVFLRRLFQVCYWLDASVVAYPGLVTDAPAGDNALRVAGRSRPAQGVWQDALAWRRVKRLSATAEPRKEPGASNEKSGRP